MWSKLEEVFRAMKKSPTSQECYEYLRQGSLSKTDDYPSSFFTFWNVETPLQAAYDNQMHAQTWVWGICFYTNDASLLYNVMDEFVDKAKSYGFVIETGVMDVNSDRADFFGRYVRILYRQNFSQTNNPETSGE